MQKQEIDFVISWVDGSDEIWKKEKENYSPKGLTDDKEERYRDWDNLQFWFRGVEKYAPWVRKIHFITYGHLPSWLNTEHPKLHIVKHEDYIPNEFLPTFSSHPIELNMHRIEGLSEQFVYFNDDFFITNRLQKKDFFIDGKPCDMLAFQPVVANPANPVMSNIYLNNTLILSKYFKKLENVKKQPGSYFKVGYPPLYFFYNLLELGFPLFSGFYTVHGPSPFLKKTFVEIWEKEEETMIQTSKQKFRSAQDISQYLFREWQKLSGDFRPKNVQKYTRYFNVDNDNKKLKQTIEKQAAKIVCINDSNFPIDFEKAKTDINLSLQKIYPDKSSFER